MSYVTFCDFIVFGIKTDPTFTHFLLMVLCLIHHCIVFVSYCIRCLHIAWSQVLRGYISLNMA